jgi:hypothetical protein
MKELYYDAEGDILTVNFPPAEAKKETGIEITDNIVLYFDTIEEKPLQMILISYSRLVAYSRRNPLELKKLSKYPKRLQRIALKLIQQAPVSHFLELKLSDKDDYHSVRVKKLTLEPKILEETPLRTKSKVAEKKPKRQPVGIAA